MTKEFIKRHREQLLYTATAQPVEFSFQDFNDNSSSNFDMILIPEVVMSASDESTTSSAAATNSSNFILPLPQTPKRKGNRVTERTSVVATSKENIERMEAKKAAKEKLEKEKRDREKLRLAKKEQKLVQDLVKFSKAKKKQRLEELTQDLNSDNGQTDLTSLFHEQRSPFEQLHIASTSSQFVQSDEPIQMPEETAPRRKKAASNRENPTNPSTAISTSIDNDQPVKRGRGRPRKTV